MSKYSVKLEREQRTGLEQLMKSGQAPARKLTHARILLKANSTKDGPNWPDTRISEVLEVSVPTIWPVRRRFVEQGLDEALNRRPQPERPNKRIFDGEKEAHLIALTCGEKPEGEGHWSVRLLADRLVKLGEVEQVSYETVRWVLKKTSPKTPAQRAMVHCPPSANADFVAHMEDVLAVSVRPYDPRFPQVCMDERSQTAPG